MAEAEQTIHHELQSATVPGKGQPWALLAVVVVALAALGLSLFAWYQVAVTTRLQVGEQGTRVNQVSSGFEEVKSGQEQVRARLGTLEASVDELGRRLKRALQAEQSERQAAMNGFRGEFDTLSNSLEQVYRDLGRTVDTWILEEVEQLLLLANQRLSLYSDVGLAQSALQIADSKLEEMGDPALLPVRKQLAAEISQLAAVPQVDLAGSSLRLQTLMQGVSELSLNEDMGGPQWETGEAPDVNDEADSLDALQQAGRDFVADLSKLVRIRKVEETRMPKLKPVQRFLIFENVRLTLNVARNALFSRQQDVYAGAIVDALNDLDRFVASGTPVSQRFRSELESLANLDLNPQLPRIEGSLNLLKASIKERQGR